MMRRSRSWILGVAATVLLVTVMSNHALADDDPPPVCGGWFGCDANAGGIDTSSTRQSVLNLPKGPDDDGHGIYQPAADAPRYEYGSTTACVVGAQPGDPSADVMCNGALMACSNPANGPGPLTRIWRRTVQTGQPPSAWQLIGTTCWADAVPGSRPPLTMAMIQDAFNRTPWATP